MIHASRDDSLLAVSIARTAAGVLLDTHTDFRGDDRSALKAAGDANAQAHIAQRLPAEVVGDAILSEEADDTSEPLTADRIRIIDPLDRIVEKRALHLVARSVQEVIDRGMVRAEPNGSRKLIQTPVLLDTVEENQIDACMGGAPRSREGSRQGTRFFFPRRIRPVRSKEPAPRTLEPLQRPGPPRREHPRVSAVELDGTRHLAVYRGVRRRDPPIYFAHYRDVFVRNGMLFAANESRLPRQGEIVETRRVRYGTVGDATLTAAVASDGHTVELMIEEVPPTRVTERGATSGDERVSEAAMEDPKKQG